MACHIQTPSHAEQRLAALKVARDALDEVIRSYASEKKRTPWATLDVSAAVDTLRYYLDSHNYTVSSCAS
jgi:hypothetical protein